MTYAESYEEGKSGLAAAGIGEAALDARLLLEHVCGTDRNTLLAHGERVVEDGELLRYRELVARRAEHVPLQQLTGVQNFMGLDFIVDGNVLIPRQDTEILVEEVLKNLHDGMRVLDLCTGTGCILTSLLRYSNDCEGVGTDISPDALAVARKNADNLLSGRKPLFLESDLYERVEGIFDVIVSNPPYIPSRAIDTLMPEVREHEPRIALDGGEDGLAFYRRILRGIGAYLKPGGMLFLEIGYDQGEEVGRLLEGQGFLEVGVTKDYGGLDRVVSGILKWRAPEGGM